MSTRTDNFGLTLLLGVLMLICITIHQNVLSLTSTNMTEITGICQDPRKIKTIGVRGKTITTATNQSVAATTVVDEIVPYIDGGEVWFALIVDEVVIRRIKPATADVTYYDH